MFQIILSQSILHSYKVMHNSDLSNAMVRDAYSQLKEMEHQDSEGVLL
jgi:hypothetical protein